MDAQHIYSLPLHANPGRLDPCINQEWIALPVTRNVIGLWKTPSTSNNNASNSASNNAPRNVKPLPVELNGHFKDICALALSNKFPTKYLASACKEKILLWSLLTSTERENNVLSQQIFSKPGSVSAMCFNNNDDIVAFASNFSITLIKVGQTIPLSVLNAHRTMILGLKYCPHYSATLISVSDDRCFYVWDTNDNVLLYQSTIISSSPLISLCMNLSVPHVAIGTASGALKVFDLTDGNNFRQLANVDLVVSLKKYFEKSSLDMNTEQSSDVIESSESVLAVQYIYFPKDNSDLNLPSLFILQSQSAAGDVLSETPPSLCVVTSNNFIQIHSKTYELLYVRPLNLPLETETFSSSKTIGSVAYAALHQVDAFTAVSVTGAMFEKEINVMKLSLPKTTKLRDDFDIGLSSFHEILSVIPKTSLAVFSPLKSEMLPLVSAKPSSGKKKQTSIMHQPLTFKNNIKSSGYTQSPHTKMFQPEKSKKKLLNINDQPKCKADSSNKVSFHQILNSTYDSSKGPPTELSSTLLVDCQSTAVFSLRFADDGNALASALSNKCGLILKAPFSKQQTISLIGHNNNVNSVFWNTDGSYLLTASNDKTVCLWDKTGGDPLLSLTHQKGSIKELSASKVTNLSTNKIVTTSATRRLSSSSSISHDGQLNTSSKENQPFAKEIKNAQFFYVDKFILLIHGPNLSMYKYDMSTKRDDVKRYLYKNRSKLISSWQTPSSVFTAMSAVNTFYSYLVFCSTSGCNTEVYDLNKSQLAHSFTKCHSRPAHCVALNSGSCFYSQPQEAYNVFATIAPTDPIKIWDLRSKSNVQILQGHLINAHACQVSFSPCGNYIASGSEDKMVYIYDLRKGTYCNRLRGHNEVVTCVDYHPMGSMLATGSLNSKIVFFETK